MRHNGVMPESRRLFAVVVLVAVGLFFVGHDLESAHCHFG